jgi:cysteine desulfurase/selenocysteine lyase
MFASEQSMPLSGHKKYFPDFVFVKDFLLPILRMFYNEFGTQNLQTILAFQDALDYLKAIGFENIRNRMLELTDYLTAGLKKMGIMIVSPVDKPEERSPIVSFSLGDRNEDCIEKLTQESIWVSPRAGYIRISVNIFNNFEDIDKLLLVLDSVISGN